VQHRLVGFADRVVCKQLGSSTDSDDYTLAESRPYIPPTQLTLPQPLRRFTRLQRITFHSVALTSYTTTSAMLSSLCLPRSIDLCSKHWRSSVRHTPHILGILLSNSQSPC